MSVVYVGLMRVARMLGYVRVVVVIAEHVMGLYPPIIEHQNNR